MHGLTFPTIDATLDISSLMPNLFSSIFASRKTSVPTFLNRERKGWTGARCPGRKRWRVIMRKGGFMERDKLFEDKKLSFLEGISSIVLVRFCRFREITNRVCNFYLLFCFYFRPILQLKKCQTICIALFIIIII